MAILLNCKLQKGKYLCCKFQDSNIAKLQVARWKRFISCKMQDRDIAKLQVAI